MTCVPARLDTPTSAGCNGAEPTAAGIGPDVRERKVSVNRTVTVVGSTNLDLVVTCVSLPQPGETVLATSYTELPGGKGSNQAVAAARMGADVRFVGCRGSDAAGEVLAASLRAEGIDVDGLRTGTGPSGRALVMVDDAAENSIIVVQGTNAQVTRGDAAAASVRDAAVVVCQLEIPLEAVLAAADAATGTFVLNPAPARPLPADLLAATDVLVLNETEYETIVGEAIPDTLDDLGLARLARRTSAPGMPATTLVTLGGRGAVLCARGQVEVCTVPPVHVRDTTGAGDTLVGALAAEIAAGTDLATATRRAVAAASLSTRALGATAGMPHRDEVIAILGSP